MSQQGTIPTIDVQAANAELADPDRRPLVVDVRERDEFAAVRLPDVALIPMSEFADRHGELPKDRRLLVMCASGSRSAAATTFLLRSGWTDVTNVAGGITAWERAGLPVRHGPVEPGEGDLKA
jgi:rhodanese-related sulfurtransferase